MLALSLSHGTTIVTFEAGVVIKPKELGIFDAEIKVVVLQGSTQVTVAVII